MISKELQARFLPRFIPLARQRILRCREVIAGGGGNFGQELHALAGEAATLGLFDLAALARAGQDALAHGAAPADEEPRLEKIEAELEALAPVVNLDEDVAAAAHYHDDEEESG